ncbi:hypothetical protein P43SY_007719 [Pythium insidiosum]|uniref:RecF/RecN/SMC N-terminal domain-containing protein n=1 Tax=Pythium insidiosum TaxID=114742 RepID=A0AAD5LPX1_PYTIN|nr:hypothetical protein P43SY_007719 [Pythium insidiosum]
MGRIARLELENFKSYGGAHVIGPFKRFTAVIGPNGSGKSNLMDAISFVLGVNSRSYRINNDDVSFDDYQNKLKDIGILVKARNFLVFQGDVESIASKSPEELTKLFEQISSSDELRDEYDRLLEEKNIAEENAIFAYQKKKGLLAEKKMVKEQKEEAERFEAKHKELMREVIAQTERAITEYEQNLRDAEAEKYDEIQDRIAKEEEELEQIKQKSFHAASNFETVKNARYERFMEAFNHISGVIDTTYKQLTKSSKHPLGALDNVNVNKVSTFIATCDFQCVVISLKDAFYEKADALVGICKDINQQRSKSLTLDLTKYD